MPDITRDPLFRAFRDICDIPHPSGGEEALASHIAERAERAGLASIRDPAGNVLVRRPASPGREREPAVMLQSHIDMVCEASDGVDHDFARDAIEWSVDGGWLSTGGRTTLGADDGIGAALAICAMEDASLDAPELELLFTVCEETDFSGANGFDGASSRARRLINLDHNNDEEVLCSSCGGMTATVALPMSFAPPPDGWVGVRIEITGLRGGHSGDDIALGHGSANSLLGRALASIERSCRVKLASLSGGTTSNAIPRSSRALICVPPEDASRAIERADSLLAHARRELPISGRGVGITAERCEAPREVCDASRVISALVLLPDAIFHMNEAVRGLPHTSDNMGVVSLSHQGFEAVLEIRSAGDGLRDHIFDRASRLASLLGGTCTGGGVYPGWEMAESSHLRDAATCVYRRLFGRDLRVAAIHAGVEVGILLEKMGGADAISLGPTCENFHSPYERLDIESSLRMKRFLWELLRSDISNTKGEM